MRQLCDRPLCNEFAVSYTDDDGFACGDHAAAGAVVVS